MKTTKLTRTLLTGMMTCTMALTAMSVSTFVSPSVTHTVLADDKEPIPEEFSLNLHKKQVFDGFHFENDGSSSSWLDEEYAGLAGVDFEVYNVTQWFYDMKALPGNEDKTDDEITKMMSDAWDYDTPKGDYVSTITTDGNGTANTKLTTKTKVNNNMVYSLYMFVELTDEESSNAAFVNARPFTLGMNKKLATQPQVDLYAKNYGVLKDLVDEKDEALKDGYYSYNVGDDLTYISSAPIPDTKFMGEGGYTGFRFLDQMTLAGTDFVRVDDIYVMKGDEKFSVKEDFDAVTSFISSKDEGWQNDQRKHAGFEYNLDFSNWEEWTHEQLVILDRLLQNIGREQLFFKYTMKINEDATPYQSIGNKFYGYFTNQHDTYETVDDAPEVETGGHEFVKLDAETDDGLKGAYFKISRVGKDGKTEFAKLLDDDNKVISSTDGIYKPAKIEWGSEADATEIVSADKGHLAIYGLKTGTYNLKETKAPTGYTFEKANTEFKVYEASVATQTLKSESVFNTPGSSILPTTGGIGIVTFLAVGALAMGGALVYKKKQA
ncbi:SpaH/EbpB family LPXTG-anchored major pilin [Lacticaseibacillus porcinae]|uniref:SpaH/EbpB family LPXTG-anchored major pilin n=1 Tax=Lacticaseibacillus porcinae TaxID=1123687 RepID=UPI000F79986D|nr:SpaH/EbpB family LPXTG-anchored major pilin [Lacticaseibacillus porcinae]